MKKIIVLLLILTGTTILGYSQKTGATLTDKSKPELFTGTWKLVSVANIYPDHSRIYPYGEHPQGILILTINGNYSLAIFRAIRQKVVSGDKNNCTPEENAALVQGSNAHYGKYSVDTVKHTILFNVEYASFPNWDNTIQERSYTYTGNELTYIVTHTTQGGQSVIAEVCWKKE